MKRATCLAVALLLALGCVGPGSRYPATTPEGLERVPDTALDAVYVRPGANLAAYHEIRLLDCRVAFRKDWQRDQNRSRPFPITQKDMDGIKRELADAFRKVFTEELEKGGGYRVVGQGGPDVLVLRPSIVDLDLVAPDVLKPGISRTYAQSAGRMTLVLELYDSVTSELLARIVDTKTARDTVSLQLQTGVYTRAAAQRILRKWARILRQGLDRLHGRVEG